MLKFAPRTKLEMKGVLSTTTNSVRETTTPNVKLTLATRGNELPNPIKGNAIGNGMTLHPIKNVSNRRTNGILHGLGNMNPAETRPLERNIDVGRVKADKM